MRIYFWSLRILFCRYFFLFRIFALRTNMSFFLFSRKHSCQNKISDEIIKCSFCFSFVWIFILLTKKSRRILFRSIYPWTFFFESNMFYWGSFGRKPSNKPHADCLIDDYLTEQYSTMIGSFCTKQKIDTFLSLVLSLSTRSISKTHILLHFIFQWDYLENTMTKKIRETLI